MAWIRLKVEDLTNLPSPHPHRDRSVRLEEVEIVDHYPNGEVRIQLRSGVRMAVRAEEAVRLLAALDMAPDVADGPAAG
jgi:hypothetical protein